MDRIFLSEVSEVQKDKRTLNKAQAEVAKSQ